MIIKLYYSTSLQVDGDVNNNAEALIAFSDDAISTLQDGLLRIADSANARMGQGGAAVRVTAEALTKAAGSMGDQMASQVEGLSPHLAQLLRGGGDRVGEGLAGLRAATTDDPNRLIVKARQQGEVGALFVRMNCCCKA